jgi:hypothetical protein
MNIPGRAVPEGGGAEPVGAAGLNGHAHYTLLALSANVSFSLYYMQYLVLGIFSRKGVPLIRTKSNH